MGWRPARFTSSSWSQTSQTAMPEFSSTHDQSTPILTLPQEEVEQSHVRDIPGCLAQVLRVVYATGSLRTPST